jgi:methylase of polypeptide subunit release factors
LDLCTGSGCIPLLSYYEFNKRGRVEEKDLEVVGVDISSTAIALANKNLLRLVEEGMLPPEPNLRFLQADILADKENEEGSEIPSLDAALEQYASTSISTSAVTSRKGNWDIIISNPPYISPAAFAHTTTRSVKRYEPRLALVPSSSTPLQDSEHGDLFYPRLLTLAAALSTKVLLFEVADLEQARRVARMAEKQGVWEGIEIWRDDPCGADEDQAGFEEGSADMVEDGSIKVLGAGNGRTVVAYRGEGKDWMCANA